MEALKCDEELIFDAQTRDAVVRSARRVTHRGGPRGAGAAEERLGRAPDRW